MLNFKAIQASPFGNTYGGLTLGEDDQGRKFLEMDDCFSPDYFGPLTPEQEAAFYTLCTVESQG